MMERARGQGWRRGREQRERARGQGRRKGEGAERESIAREQGASLGWRAHSPAGERSRGIEPSPGECTGWPKAFRRLGTGADCA